MHLAAALLAASMAATMAGCAAPTGGDGSGADVERNRATVAQALSNGPVQSPPPAKGDDDGDPQGSATGIDCDLYPDDPSCPSKPSRGGRLPCAVCAMAVDDQAIITIAPTAYSSSPIVADIESNGTLLAVVSIPPGAQSVPPVKLPITFAVPTPLQVSLLTPILEEL
jgi:hypothetical protein